MEIHSYEFFPGKLLVILSERISEEIRVCLFLYNLWEWKFPSDPSEKSLVELLMKHLKTFKSDRFKYIPNIFMENFLNIWKNFGIFWKFSKKRLTASEGISEGLSQGLSGNFSK